MDRWNRAVYENCVISGCISCIKELEAIAWLSARDSVQFNGPILWFTQVIFYSQFLDFPGAKVGFINKIKFTAERPQEPVPCFRVLDDHGRLIKDAYMPEVGRCITTCANLDNNEAFIYFPSHPFSYLASCLSFLLAFCYEQSIAISAMDACYHHFWIYSAWFLISCRHLDDVIQVDKPLAIRMYQNMVTLQVMDTLFFEAQRQGRFSFYLTTFGEEAINIASAAALNNDDMVYAQVNWSQASFESPKGLD